MWRPTEAGAAPGFAGRASSAEIGRWSCRDRRRLAPARWVPARSRAGERRGTAYPLGGRGSSEASGRSAPLPRLPGGGPHFSREMGRKRAGAPPLDPRYYGRSFPLADFWDRCFWYDSGAITSDMLRPIWGAFSGKNMLKSIFAKDSPQIRARKWLQLKTTTVPLRPATPKRASGNERVINPGVQGARPPALFPPAFSGESRAPARSRAGNPRRRF